MSLTNHKKLTTIIGIFRTIHPELPLPLILVFLEIAQSGDDGLTVSQVEKRCGISQSATSRHCRMLTDQTVRGRKGHKLCDNFLDKNDSRITQYRLNRKGKAIYSEILRALS